MSDEHDENAADKASGGASWPMNLLKGTSINDTDPLQATHPTVIAVCNVLMFDGPVDYKAWHCPAEHVRTRETMEQCISHLILQRRPSATQEWIEKLPEVSKRIEKSLYFSARSIDDYSDPYTLVNRIQELVKVLITTAATLPIPAPGSSPAEQASHSHSHHKSSLSLEAGEDETSEDNQSERADGPARVKAEAATPLRDHSSTGASSGLSDLGNLKSIDLIQAPLYLVPLKEAELVQQQAAAVAAASSALQQPLYLASSQVSSQGCSRVFIIKVLISVSEFVKGKSLPSIFTFKRELVMDWLIAAKQACCLPTYLAEEGYYGGPPFVNPDPSTHWSEPHQLYTWWKNNVERRSKFKVLQEDAKFKGLDPRRLQRARWCEAVVALSELIRASSGSSNASRTAQQSSASASASAAALANSASQASALALVGGNPLTNSTAYIQALTASMQANAAANEDTTSESSGGNGNNGSNGFYHLPGLPSFAQVHSATTADDRSGIDALMHMSSEMNSFLHTYGSSHSGKGPALPQGLSAGPNPMEMLASLKNEGDKEKNTFEGYSPQAGNNYSTSHLSAYLPQQHLYPGKGSAASGSGSSSSKTDSSAPTGLTPGLSAAMQSAGLSLDTALNQGTPLLGKFVPPPSNLIIGTHIIPGTNIPYRNYSNTFPVKLFDLVSSEDEAVVGWQGHGTSFQVRDMDKFVNIILPKHFKHNNFTSFQRQLNLYGFRRSASYDKGAYYHPQFQQNQRELAESIRRVLAPTSSSGGGGGGGDKGHGEGSGAYGMSASALAMSYLSTLPPGATVTLPGMPGASAQGQGQSQGQGQNQGSYTRNELNGGDGAAESLLSMGGGGGKGGSSSGSGPTPLPLSSWAPGAGAGVGAGPAGSGPNSAYWQNMAANPYLAASNGHGQNPYLQYPGLGGIGIDGATGAYGMMTQLAQQQHLHQQMQLQNKLFKVPPRGYNRNSTKRNAAASEEAGAGGAPRRTKLSARDRKLLDMSTNFNAEQFLASTVISDRYNLGTNSSLLAGQPPHGHHHHGHGHHTHRHKGSRKTARDEGDEEEEGGARKNRPAKRRAKAAQDNSSDEYGDETTYQDGAEEEDAPRGRSQRAQASQSQKSGRKVKPSRRALAAAGEDESSDASDAGPATKGGRRTSGSGPNSRNSSYKNLPQDVLAKSGLSRHSAITHLTQDAEDDLLDLRNPRRRVYLDFTVLGQLGQSEAAVVKAEEKGEEKEKSAADYVCGFYRGALTQGKKDVGLHYQLHGSRVLPEALLRQNETTAPGASSPQSLSSVIAAQNKNNSPRSTRVGEDFQCDIPALSAVPNPASPSLQGLSRRSASSYTATVPVWRPDALSTECVDAFMELLRARKKLIPLPVGSVLVVRLREEKAYRLCCVLDVYFADPTPRDSTLEGTPRTPATPALGKLLENSTVRVFDGYEDWVVPATECTSFKEGEMELALQLLVKHQGQITPTLVQEVDWLLQSGVCSEGSVFAANSAPPTSWTADEVLRFCTAVKRYGDNIKKVWELRFEESGKSIEEVQEFFLRIYPHTQLGGAKRVVSVFSRGELAAAGFPDGEASSDSSVDGEGEGDAGEGEEEDGDLESVSHSSSGSRSSSNSATNSEAEDEEGEGEGDEEESRSASRGTSSEVGSALNAHINISSSKTTTVVASGRGGARVTKTSVTAVTVPAPVTASGRRSSGAAQAPAPAPVVVEDRRSGRKRGSQASEEPAAAVSIPTHALVPSAALESAKKRRR